MASRHGGGAPWLLLLALFDFEFEAIVCPKLLQEFSDALGNRYFQERFDAGDLEGIVANVAEVATEYDDPAKVEPLLRDPGDDYLVALAREAGCRGDRQRRQGPS